MKKLTIQQAAAMLESKGYTLLNAAPWRPGKETSYVVRSAAGDKVLTVTQIKSLIG